MKGFWKCWGDNSSLDWTSLTILNYEEYLSTDSGPTTTATAAAPVPTPTSTTTMDVTTITNALSAALLTKPLSSHTDIFLKNKGRGDEPTVKLPRRSYIIRPYKLSPMDDEVDETLIMADVVTDMDAILVGVLNLVALVHIAVVATTSGYHVKKSII